MKEKKEKPGKKGGTAKPLGGGGGDDRFAAIGSDPRFARFPKVRRHDFPWFASFGTSVLTASVRLAQAKGRVAVDNRFKAVFDDPRFATAAKTDKRGRKTQG